MRQVDIDTHGYGIVTAIWERKGKYLVVRYGDREKRAQASADDTVNEIVARDVLRGWVAEDSKDLAPT